MFLKKPKPKPPRPKDASKKLARLNKIIAKFANLRAAEKYVL
jgi:hypothetical protein